MTREEFSSLPLSIALGLIYDVLKSRLEGVPKPKLPLPPKYDGRIGRQGGFNWLSEMSLESLVWWHKEKLKGAERNDQHTARNKKTAENISKWIAWRRVFPTEQWMGIRGEEKAVAEFPSKKPELNKWDDRKTPDAPAGRNGSQQPRQASDDDDFIV